MSPLLSIPSPNAAMLGKNTGLARRCSSSTFVVSFAANSFVIYSLAGSQGSHEASRFWAYEFVGVGTLSS
jgi:hypothetical protein